jgi:hypothetical protein
MARLERELSSARLDIGRLEENAEREGASDEQVMRLQRELDEIRLKASSGQRVGAVSSREFLDLREALNKKEKEILSLRDQITRKEKDLLDASDSALVLERDKADLEDKIGALEKDVHSARALAETARRKKGPGAKRAEDGKTRRAGQGGSSKPGSRAPAIQKRHEDEMTAALSQLREAEQRARDEALTTLKQEAEADKAALVAAREAALTREAEERIAALTREAEERIATLTREAEERIATLAGTPMSARSCPARA